MTASCAALSSGSHELAANVLIRLLIELGIKVHWATLSSENAKHLLASSKDQVKVIFTANAKTPSLRIVDSEGNDLAEECIASGISLIKNLQKRLSDLSIHPLAPSAYNERFKSRGHTR